MGKGEIARYEQFLLFPQCFQETCFSGASKDVIVWEWVNSYIDRSKFKEFAVDNLKFDEHGRKFSQTLWKKEKSLVASYPGSAHISPHPDGSVVSMSHS